MGPDLWPPLPPPPSCPPSRGTAKRRGAAALLLLLALGSMGALIAATVGSGIKPEYSFEHRRADGTPYRWDPCKPIHYVVDLNGEPASALADVQEAVRRVQAATGIPWIYDGLSRATAEEQLKSLPESDSKTWPPVLITWETQGGYDLLAGRSEASLAFALPETGFGSEAETYESALVVVDESADIAPGFGSRASLGVVLMHELAHVMGLGHVGSGHELMWSPLVNGADAFPDLSLTDWGPGDLRGLRLVGRLGALCSSLGA